MPTWYKVRSKVSIPQAVGTVATCLRGLPLDGYWWSFNTASGKHCYFITFVFPSLRSGTRDVRSSSSLRSSAASHPSSHTASGRYCCNLRWWRQIHRHLQVSIPQAVSTVTSLPLFSPPFGQGLEMCGPHRRFAPLLPRTLRRIPQAVGTVATVSFDLSKDCIAIVPSFNTASGRYCCNPFNLILAIQFPPQVSIPQAVGTVATHNFFTFYNSESFRFQYRKR